MNALYTVGYGAGWTPEQLAAVVAERGALLFDIRYRPWSKSPQWQEPALRALLGNAYRHIPALGNRNYNNGGPIALVDPKRGAATVLEALARQPVILLCGCRDYWTCHREEAADLVAAPLGILVEHLQPFADRPPPPMLPRETEQAFSVDRSPPEITDDGVKLWRMRFFGAFVGFTRRPGQEVAELNEKWRIAQQKRRAVK